MAKIRRGKEIEKAQGPLGVLIPGVGAVTTTMLAGVFSAVRGLSRPLGAVTQYGRIRLGRRDENKNRKVKDFVPLADPGDLVFGGWDIFPENAHEAAVKAGVLKREHIEPVREELRQVPIMKAVFDRRFVERLDGPHVKRGSSKMHLAEQLIKDIEGFRKRTGAKRMVMCWAASTEAFSEVGDCHRSLEQFEQGLRENHPAISSSQIYAYAALQLKIPYINGAPHVTVDCPALLELARQNSVPVCGKDFKTGQTLMKTIVAPGLQARLLGISGWFSTNILGNRDGEVLDCPENFKSKEVSKLGVLDTILRPDLYPELYRDLYHKIRINYYPPRGDNKESWDNIDLFGWMDYPMEIKINFLCRDSILAAPVMLDLILFTDLAQRAGMHGILEWLSFYFKSPMTREDLYPENDLFKQRSKLFNTLRFLMEEELVHHTGLDYYYDISE